MPQTIAEILNFDNAQEKRPFGHGELQLVTVGGKTVGRGVFHAGWVWSQHVKPIAGTDHCMFEHYLVPTQGRMEITMAGAGDKIEVGPGDVAAIPPGHDAKVLGDEDFIALDLSDQATDYAKK